MTEQQQLTPEQQKRLELQVAYMKVKLEENKESPTIKEITNKIDEHRKVLEATKQAHAKAGARHNQLVAELRKEILKYVPEEYRDEYILS